MSAGLFITQVSIGSQTTDDLGWHRLPRVNSRHISDRRVSDRCRIGGFSGANDERSGAGPMYETRSW